MKPNWIARVLDFASDWAVLAFALWTLLAYLGMAAEARVSLLTAFFLLLAPAAGVALYVLRRRSTPRVPGSAQRQELPEKRTIRPVYVAGLALAAIAATLTGHFPWILLWLPSLAAVLIAIRTGRLAIDRGFAEAIQRWPADAFAAVVGVGLGAMSLFLFDQNPDDAFYVNRATATAQLNHIPVRDVLLTDEQVPRLGGTGLPVEAFAAFQGALGRLLEIHPASVAYYVTPPAMTFLSTWALWRLIRAWAPARAAVCFALGCIFLLWSAQTDLSPGNFFLTRIWQGKVIFVAWLVPTLYVYLTRWLSRRDAPTGLLLVGAGICAIGLTSSAALVVPLIALAAAIPLLANRDWRGLPVVVAAAGIPFAVGFGARLWFAFGNRYPAGTFPTDWYYRAMFGVGIVGVLAALGVWAAPLLARRGPPAAIATGIAIVAVVLLAPYALSILHAIGDVPGRRSLRRAFWVIPFPVLVGLLAAVPLPEALTGPAASILPRIRPLVVLGPALLVAVLLVGFGNPLWLTSGGVSKWESKPTWKTNEARLETARAILSRYDGTGPVLADQRVMKAIALLTVEPKAVNPRSWYTLLTEEPEERTKERLALTKLAGNRRPFPPRTVLGEALSDLSVGLVCMRSGWSEPIELVEAAGPYVESFRTHGMTCLESRPPT